jgi:UDP-N-acetyl-D-mannosaminuronate dehydrogenase
MDAVLICVPTPLDQRRQSSTQSAEVTASA